jgi:hypothetical protein
MRNILEKGVYGCGVYIPNLNWLNVPRYPALGAAVIASAASHTIRVYWFVRRGTSAELW